MCLGTGLIFLGIPRLQSLQRLKNRVGEEKASRTYDAKVRRPEYAKTIAKWMLATGKLKHFQFAVDAKKGSGVELSKKSLMLCSHLSQ